MDWKNTKDQLGKKMQFSSMMHMLKNASNLNQNYDNNSNAAMTWLFPQQKFQRLSKRNLGQQVGL